MKLELPIDIEDSELNRIKSVFSTHLNYYIVGINIEKDRVVLTFKKCRNDAREEILQNRDSTTQNNHKALL